MTNVAKSAQKDELRRYRIGFRDIAKQLRIYMRCYLVSIDLQDIQVKRIASTNADARTTRETLMSEFDVKKKDVTIEQHEVPVAKPDLIAYLNELYEATDVNIEDSGE